MSEHVGVSSGSVGGRGSGGSVPLGKTPVVVPSDVRDRVNADEMTSYSIPCVSGDGHVGSLEKLAAVRAAVRERRGFRQKMRRNPTAESVDRALRKLGGAVNRMLRNLRVPARTLSYFRNENLAGEFIASSGDIRAMQRMVFDKYYRKCGRTGEPDHALLEQLLDDALRSRPRLALLALELCVICTADADNASNVDSLPDGAVDMPKPAGNMFSGIGRMRLTAERRRNDVRFIMGTDLPVTLDCGVGQPSDMRPNVAGMFCGATIGRGTNARKNKSGKDMETLFYNLLGLIVAEYPQLHFERQVRLQHLRELGVCRLDGIGDDPQFDAVLWSDYGDMYIIETNFYAGSGSKPLSIADGYVARGRIIERANEGVHMCVFTDGTGWRKAKKSFAKLCLFFGRGLATFNDVINADGSVDIVAAVRAFAPVYYANNRDAINADELRRQQERMADGPTA